MGTDTDEGGRIPAVTGLRLAAGTFTARVAGGPAVPVIDVVVDGHAVAAAKIEASGDGDFRLSARLQRECLRDGTVLVVFQDRASGAPLAVYPVRAGGAVEEDPSAEIAILRGELEALKRAFMAEAWHEKLRAAERPIIVAEAVEAVERYLAGREAEEGA